MSLGEISETEFNIILNGGKLAKENHDKILEEKRQEAAARQKLDEMIYARKERISKLPFVIDSGSPLRLDMNDEDFEFNLAIEANNYKIKVEELAKLRLLSEAYARKVQLLADLGFSQFSKKYPKDLVESAFINLKLAFFLYL